MGEERIAAILQETLATAVKTEAIRPTDLTGVIIDATVQEKTSACPNDARLAQRARERLVRLAKAHGLKLRQSYVRVGKLAMTKHQRYAHAKQYKRATSCLRTLKTYLGRTIRYIERGIGKARAGAP